MTMPSSQLSDMLQAAQLVEGHLLHEPDLTIRRRFVCLGFPVELATNSVKVEAAAAEAWRSEALVFDVEPIRIKAIELPSDNVECPPAPMFRSLGHVGIQVADSSNFLMSDFESALSQLVVSSSALSFPSYFRYFFLEAAAYAILSSRYTLPIHAACVSLRDRGVLLCGESGAGKSSLAYACARAGWKYTTDDASYLVLQQPAPTVVGNCHQFRFRPTARELFPELQNFEVTPRAAGKPSIEVATNFLSRIEVQQAAKIDALVFLHRVPKGPPVFTSLQSGYARNFILQTQYGPQWLREQKAAAADRLLDSAAVIRLTYSSFEDAIEQLGYYVGATR